MFLPFQSAKWRDGRLPASKTGSERNACDRESETKKIKSHFRRDTPLRNLRKETSSTELVPTARVEIKRKVEKRSKQTQCFK